MNKTEIKKGDIVVCVLSGNYGKPRPAVVIQSNSLNKALASILVCPITTYLINTAALSSDVDSYRAKWS